MDWTNRIGNWNPQFLRECRGRLKPRNVIAALGCSILFQGFLCLILLRAAMLGQFSDRWLDICQFITWIVPYFLLTVGSYYLVNDLAQEEKQGTLNFIRLSPRPASEILLGKLLGVPILPYIIVLSMVPLHLWSILQNQISIGFFFSYYSLLTATAFICFSLALLTGVTSQQRPQQNSVAIVFAALSLFLFAPSFMVWHSSTSWRRLGNISRLFPNGPMFPSVNWLYTSLSTDTLIAHVFTLANLAIVGVLVWLMLRRLFHQPTTTLLSKRVSYALTAYLNIVVWGFSQQELALGVSEQFSILYLLNFGISLLLMLALTPHRQQLFDWLNYPRAGIMAQLWADKSPAVIAIAVNILIAGLLVVPSSIIVVREGLTLAYLLLMPVSIALSWLTYATITQIICTARVRMPSLWVAGTITVLIVVPLSILWLFQAGSPPASGWMIFRTVLGYPFYNYPQPGYFNAVIVGIAIQGLILLGLLGLLQQRLTRLRRLMSAG